MQKRQIDVLADHFMKKGDISPHEARDIYRIDSFHRRLSDLKDRGFKFRSESRTDLTGKRYRRYFVIETPRGMVRRENPVTGRLDYIAPN